MHSALQEGKCLLHHSRRYSVAVQGPGDRLKQARERRFATAKEAAEAMNVPVSSYIQHENGLRGFRADKAKQYADFFRVTPEWLLYGREGPKPPTITARPSRGYVPLVGYVGAGAEAHYYASADEGLGEVEAPDNATPQTVAVEIRGTSLGPLFESWLVFYDEVRSPVTPDMYGRLCVVGLPDGRVLVKRIRPARTPGVYHLESNTEPTMPDEEVVWAARVKSMTPR
ncbi:LexA family transcriptional regulator [Phenylobacterium sp. VNQ135]|uniref:LexA family transcriptional regulator n=1 Tax=Phenylobacterium sp. VNQ135 TaxID=3400922 RepID=UPI003BFC69F0